MGEAVIHLAKRMNDEINRRFEALGYSEFLIEPFFGIRPIFDPVGNILAIDDYQEIKIRPVAFCRVRLVDPTAARITAIENDL